MRISAILAVVLFLVSAPAALAADGVAFMDSKRVTTESDALKDVKKQLDAKFGPQKNDLEKDRQEIDKLIEQYKDKEPTTEQAEALRKREREFADKVQAFMRLFQADEVRYTQELDAALNRGAKELALRKGYSMILDVSAAAYFDPKLDVTEEIIGEVNVQWKKMQSADGAKQ